MKTGILLTVAGLLAWSSIAAWAAPPDAAGIASQGNGHGAPPCASCHAADGAGQPAAGFPRLAGLNEAYLARQLDDFASGSRANPVMAPIAKALSEDERRALAAYYSGMPIPAAAAKGTTPPTDALGEQLALHGRWNKQVPACVACHGPHGVGVGEHFPPLAGQSTTYIANQLREWQQGKRKNDPLGLMQHVASALDDNDVDAVAAWFAAQPAAVPGGKP
ncbi:MAG TPA: c-type cytochrome [Rhodanobacteraceae bacterium]